MSSGIQTVFICLLSLLGVVTVAAESCVGFENVTCVNYEVCQDEVCECPSTYYGDECQYSLTNALLVSLICIVPPMCWTAVYCYGSRIRRLSKRRGVAQPGEQRSGTDPSPVMREQFIDDQPPPTYSQVLTFDRTGVYETIEMTAIDGDQTQSGGATEFAVTLEIEAPPSYDEWMLKAASLMQQESRLSSADGDGQRIATVSENMNSGLTGEISLAGEAELGICNPVSDTYDGDPS